MAKRKAPAGRVQKKHAGAKVDYKQLQKKWNATKFNSFKHAAGTLRNVARKKVRKRKVVKGTRDTKGKKGKKPDYAKPGEAPKTVGGKLKNAILFDATEDGAVIGIAKSRLGAVGSAHEHGGRFRGAMFPKRPLMVPALKMIVPRLNESMRIKR